MTYQSPDAGLLTVMVSVVPAFLDFGALLVVARSR
jgi:hypothetical protein